MSRYLCLVLIFLAGCATVTERSAQQKPSWITGAESSPAGSYFVGMSPAKKTLALARKEAINDALARVAQGIGVRVKAHNQLIMNSLSSEFKADIETTAKGKIENTHIQDMYYEEDKTKGTFQAFVLMYYSNKEMEKARKDIAEENALQLSRAKDTFIQGLTQENSGKAAESFQSYSFAMEILEKSDDTEKLQEKILNQAINLYRRLSIIKVNDPVDGTVKEGLKQPLKTRVMFENPGKNILPVSGFPVNYGFIEGRGEIERLVFTDSTGIALSKVSRLDTIRKDNSVEAYLSFGSLIQVNEFLYSDTLKRISPKRIEFVFGSKGQEADTRVELLNLVVRNFQNLTGDESFDWLSAGIAEILSNKFSRVKTIKINSLSALKSSGEPYFTIGGSYQKEGGNLRLIGLVSGSKSSVAGSVMVTGTPEKIFELQDELALKLSGALKVPLAKSSNEKSTSSVNIKAYRSFSEGLRAFQSCDYDSAILAYQEAIKNDPLFGDAYNNLGLSYYKKKESAKAKDMYEKALTVNNTNEKARINLAVLHYGEGEYEKSAYVLSQSGAESLYAYEVNLLLGAAYEKEGLLDKAAASYQKAAEMNTSSADACVGLGSVYLKNNELEKAREQFEKALSRDQRSSKAYNYLGIVYDRMKEQAKAVYYFRTAISLEQYNGTLWSNLGRAYAHNNEVEPALNAHLKAVELSPDNMEVFYNIACFYSGIKEKDKAIQSLQKAVELGFKDKTLLENDESFKNLIEDPRFKKLLGQFEVK
ncbi:MAG: hypothetical protein A2452_03675 [Candidatus Firestonebacteria bacterium RIFOXYC2_FULL_39_67]|nr:MAG: hypothetical protein A2452_03675 [Candidatus Firestonebacteria bacterium RIFOXYC2_FULL_39_67]